MCHSSDAEREIYSPNSEKKKKRRRRGKGSRSRKKRRTMTGKQREDSEGYTLRC